MSTESIDPLRKFLVTGRYSNHCNVHGCLIPPVGGTYLCGWHLEKANNYFSAQLGLDPLYHMKHDAPLQYGTAWTYFVGCREQGVVKIGVTTRLKSRMSALRNNSPIPIKLFAVVYGHPGIEPALHERFSESRLHGEWFRISDEIKDCIDAIKDREFAKYIPASLMFETVEDRALHIADSISNSSGANRIRDKTPVLDFLNGR